MSAAMTSMRTVWSVAPSLPATTMYAAQGASRIAASGATRAAQSVRATCAPSPIVSTLTR
jgi:hypothetical protein